MKCFSHQETESLGVCKFCQKAICQSCLIDTGRGIACSAQCESEVIEMNEMVDKSKQIYRIGAAQKLFPIGVLINILFGALFTAFGIYVVNLRGNTGYFMVALGVVFLLMAAMVYFRSKKLNLNC